MYSRLETSLEDLAGTCLGRPAGSLFQLNQALSEEWRNPFQDATILVTGAAGFIARSTLRRAIESKPKHLYLLDSSENGLAELARDLNAEFPPSLVQRTTFIFSDIASPILPRALAELKELDLVLHFAAAKHVRSERGVASALRVLETNVIGTQRLLETLAERAQPPAVFAVSTDKAVAPSSVMGASKALMESLLWTYPGQATTTRFANVMFSSGSLTETWLKRFENSLPLSAPIDTKRFFITPAEAGDICTLAAAAPDRSVVVPRANLLEPIDLLELATGFLAHVGRRANLVEYDAQMGVNLGGKLVGSSPDYLVLWTERNTPGEKSEEQFVAVDERASPWMANLDRVTGCPGGCMEEFLSTLQAWLLDPSLVVSMRDVRGLMKQALPTYAGGESPLSLDSRF